MYLKKINLKNKIALVTGAGKGIGKACAIALAEAGADLVIISRTQKDLDAVSKIIKKFKSKCTSYVCDVTNYNQIKNVIAKQKNGLLKNKTFLVTGKLKGISRAEVKSLIEENSGITVSTVSNKLNYLIIGEKPTRRKVESAKELKIKIINQKDFLKMLNKTS